MEIRKAKKDEINQITDVLNEATLDLQSKGINQWSYPWKAEDIKVDTSYALLINNKIIGTFFISKIGSLSNLKIPKDSIYLSKIAISPNFQGKSLGKEIVHFACSLAIKMDKALFLDCWSGNQKLKEFYTNSGLDYLGDYPEEDYFISIFNYTNPC